MASLFDPVALGALQLRDCIVMAPMTRNRAGPGDAPSDMNVEYYRQRAGAGLIITEGVWPSPDGKGYARTPGVHTEAQVQGWREVARAVHDQGGRIVMQLMHCGRAASRHNKDAETVAPSAIAAKAKMFTDAEGLVEMDTPRALETAEIPQVVDAFATAARNARAAGMDGVELHCTSGYLPMQFLSTGTNRRTDGYGGPTANRIRFVVETLQALAGAVGADRVGYRIYPGNPFNDMHDDDPAETYAALMRAASPLGLAYLHLIHAPTAELDALALAKANWRGAIVLNNDLTLERAAEHLARGDADAVAFGRPFIANPDLGRRFREGAPLAAANNKTNYTPGPVGYIDYPPLPA